MTDTTKEKGMSEHGIVKCSECNKVIRQCRCMAGHRNVTYEICGACQNSDASGGELDVDFSTPL